MDTILEVAGYGFIAIVLLVVGYVFSKILISSFQSMRDSDD